MTIDKLIIFGIFTLGYSLSMKYFSNIGFRLRETVKSRFLRVVVMIIMFCIVVHFQAEFSDLEVLSMNAVFYSLINGMCLCILMKLIFYKKLI